MKVTMKETTTARATPDGPKVPHWAGEIYEVDERVAASWLNDGICERAPRAKRATTTATSDKGVTKDA